MMQHNKAPILKIWPSLKAGLIYSKSLFMASI